jgi:phosphohistidine phosphatase SixA
MDVYLVRHAIAHERSRARWPKDALRPLTAAGILPKSAQVLTSPYVRARDTAAILTSVAKLRVPVEASELASGMPARAAFELLRSHKEAAIVLVGHEPNLSILLSVALGGDGTSLKIAFKKGGAACIEFAGSIQPGHATLKWMMPPRALRALKR